MISPAASATQQSSECRTAEGSRCLTHCGCWTPLQSTCPKFDGAWRNDTFLQGQYLSSVSTSDERRWSAVLERRELNPAFVYAVTSTGIFCRPTCPSRRPNRPQVSFFASSDLAERAGFRACKRCRPTSELDPDLEARQKVEQACRLIEQAGGPVPVETLAAATGWSERHLHRAFRRVLGTTPIAFGRTIRAAKAREALRSAKNISDVIYESGYGSSRAFYEELVPRLGSTPRTYAAGSKNVDLSWAAVETSIGTAVIVASESGLCAVRIGEPEKLLDEIVGEFPHASLTRNQMSLEGVGRAIAALADGESADAALPLDIRTTAFESRVWEAVRRIPVGETRSYSDIASEIGEPQASRAVGSAVGRNPVALVIPCHRVIRSDGSLGGYRWGLEVKEKLLRSELSKRTNS